MKKYITILSIFILSCFCATAQNNLKLVPSSASMIIRYAGENFMKNVPIKKFDSYSFVKDGFLKSLQLDKKSSLQNTGINFESDMYQYVFKQDTCDNFITLLQLKNEAQFIKMIKANYKYTSKIENKNGFSMIAVSNSMYIGWNKSMAIIVSSDYQTRKNYYDQYPYTTDTTYSAAVAADTAVAYSEDIIEEKMDTLPLTEEDLAKQELEAEKQRIKDSINDFKYELWQQQQEMIAKKQQQIVAENIMTKTFSGNIKSIENDAAYNKIIDPSAHISAFLSTENVISQYQNYFKRGYYGIMGNISRSVAEPADGFKSSVNIFFDKDKLRMEQKSFSPNAEDAKLALDVMNSKQSTELVNYVNPGNIGYFSMSINTEAMANYYYSFMKKYLSNSGYFGNDYSDIIDIYIDLIQIIVDEKAIAELFPGNYMFVMHDLKPQIVDYTDYDYDAEYNRKEVKKTRKELSPDFTFVFQTKKDAFMEKLAHLPLKYAEKEHFDYKEKEGYYVYTFDSGKYPIANLYFMVKDNKAFVTTSLDVINMAKTNVAFATDAATKKSILDNNYSFQLNTKKLIEKLQTQFTTDVNKKISDYMLQNLGDVKMESSVKDGIIQSTATMNITGKHSNSLEFFFNMIDSVNNIIEKDKQEQEKKIY